MGVNRKGFFSFKEVIFNHNEYIVIVIKAASLKVFSHGILSYFDHVKSDLLIEGKLKITVYSDRKTAKR